MSFGAGQGANTRFTFMRTLSKCPSPALHRNREVLQRCVWGSPKIQVVWKVHGIFEPRHPDASRAKQGIVGVKPPINASWLSRRQ